MIEFINSHRFKSIQNKDDIKITFKYFIRLINFATKATNFIVAKARIFDLRCAPLRRYFGSSRQRRRFLSCTAGLAAQFAAYMSNCAFSTTYSR